MPLPVLIPETQIAFYYKLKTIRDLYLHEGLSLTIKELKISEIDKELNLLVSNESLAKLASNSLRGEIIFPVPIILNKNPHLLGYYRLLYGFSQKEFYTKGFSKYKSMETNGIKSKRTHHEIEIISKSLIKSGEYLVNEMDEFDIKSLSELQLLTLGSQFRGTLLNKIGFTATLKIFSLIKELVKNYIAESSETQIFIKNDSGRSVKVAFASDPDIEITTPSLTKGLASIEIKGGKDISNIHNRIGEAEKSHQKAKKRGHTEFITIINVEFDYKTLKTESPTTTYFYNMDKIMEETSDERIHFKHWLSNLLGINI